jgi:hypothetical protein
MYFTSEFIHFNHLRGELIWKTKVGEPESSWKGLFWILCWLYCSLCMLVAGVWWTENKCDYVENWPYCTGSNKIVSLKKNTFRILSDSPKYKRLSHTPRKTQNITEYSSFSQWMSRTSIGVSSGNQRKSLDEILSTFSLHQISTSTYGSRWWFWCDLVFVGGRYVIPQWTRNIYIRVQRCK